MESAGCMLAHAYEHIRRQSPEPERMNQLILTYNTVEPLRALVEKLLNITNKVWTKNKTKKKTGSSV